MNTIPKSTDTPLNKRVGDLLVGWNELDIIQAQADYLKETGDYPDRSDNEIYQMAAKDADHFAFEWEYLCDYLTELMGKNKHGGWKAIVSHFGWRELNGSKAFQATTGKELLQAILPQTDCTFRVYRYGRGFAINNAHHDSPYWREWYYIMPYKVAQSAAA